MYFKDIIQQIIDKMAKRGNFERRLGGVFCYVYATLESDSATIRRFYADVTRFWAGAEITDRSDDIPNFKDFTNAYGPPVTQTRVVLARSSEIQRAALERDSKGGFNLALRSSFLEMGVKF